MKAEDRLVDRILKKEYRIGKFTITAVDMLYVFIITMLGLYVRKQMFPMKTSDWMYCLDPWMGKIREYGGWRSLGKSVSDYSSMYMYVMVIVSYLPVEAMAGLKWVSVIFDFMLAVSLFLVTAEVTGSRVRSMAAYTVFLLLPTTVMNGAAWTQCDSIYGTFIMLSLLYLLKGRGRVAVVWFSVAFSFKLQAVFFLPVLIICWLVRRVKLADFLWIPAVYILSCVPAWLAGRPWKELLTIYTGQMSQYQKLTLNYPNIYAITGEIEYNTIVSRVGICVTIMVFGLLAYCIYGKCEKISNQMVVSVSLFSVLLCVYVLPHMHERYGYLAEVLSIVYGICNIRRIWVSVVMELVALCLYIKYLFSVNTFSYMYMALVIGAVLIWVLYDLIMDIKAERMKVENEG
jgi:Gpi18-like mannosyltransferase